MTEKPEYQQKEVYGYKELMQIADKIAYELIKELDEYFVNTFVEFGKIYIDIGVDFGEISDAVASRIYDMVKDGEIEEEDAFGLFDTFFEEELEQINEENCVYVNGRIETERYIVEFEPLECLGDNCVAGLTAIVQFKDKVTDIDVSNIANLIITVFRL